jgi:hypothetical protein
VDRLGGAVRAGPGEGGIGTLITVDLPRAFAD